MGGFQTFCVLWFGQLISVVGTALTGFALGVWVFQRTGSVTRFALISLFTTLPGIVLAPFAGALVDRWDRRRAMIVSDTGAGLATLAIALILYSQRGQGLTLWPLYAAMTCVSLFTTLQWPAFSAATTLLVGKRHLTRAAGMSNFSQGAANLLAPLLGGVLLLALGVHAVVLLDFASFLIAAALALTVRVPRPVAVSRICPKFGAGFWVLLPQIVIGFPSAG